MNRLNPVPKSKRKFKGYDKAEIPSNIRHEDNKKARNRARRKVAGKSLRIKRMKA